MEKSAKKTKATITDVLIAMNTFATHIEKELAQSRTEMKQLRIDTDGGLVALRKDMEKEFVKMEWKLVTKDYLDEKLHDLKGDLILIARKEDKKMAVLVKILKKKKVLAESEAHLVLQLEPFAQ